MTVSHQSLVVPSVDYLFEVKRRKMSTNFLIRKACQVDVTRLSLMNVFVFSFLISHASFILPSIFFALSSVSQSTLVDVPFQRSVVALLHYHRQSHIMLGGFSSKSGPADFAPSTKVQAPQTILEWKTALNGVKSLYLQRQYKQCAARCTELLTVAKEPVCSTSFALMYETDAFNIDRAHVQTIPFLLLRYQQRVPWSCSTPVLTQQGSTPEPGS